MYIPKAFRCDDTEELIAFMRAHNFVTLVSCIDGAPFASHIPVVVGHEAGTVRLTGHLAKANPHWKAFGTSEAVAVFHGPHAYISPALYENSESVPTWNYVAVHAYGTPQSIMMPDAREALIDVVETLIVDTDPSYIQQWDGLSEKYREGMLQGIVGFEMRVSRLEGKYKLSQNRSLTDQANVAQTLMKHSDPTTVEVGAAMQQNLEPDLS